MVAASPEAIPAYDKTEMSVHSVGNEVFDDAYRIAPAQETSSTSSTLELEATAGAGVDAGVLAQGEDGFQITSSTVDVLPSLTPAFDPVFRANELEAAFNEGLLDIGTDKERALSALRQLSPEQIDQVESVYAEMNITTPLDEVRSEGLSASELELFESIFSSTNQIPVGARVDGVDKLIDGSGLTAGETNRVTLPDGRQYDIYVPKNVRNDLSVIIAPHGTEFGDAAENRTIEKESGLNQLAEQYGVVIVYPFAKPRESGIFGTDKGLLQGSGWNLAGHVDLSTDDLSYDDGAYFDDLIADVNNRVVIDATQISFAGFSDGARAAAQYIKDRPGQFHSFASMSGTWMESETFPEPGTGLRTMIVHGGRDYMLDYDQGAEALGGLSEIGIGPVSDIMDFLGYVPNFEGSRPRMQLEAAAAANGAHVEPAITSANGVRTTKYAADQTETGNEVIEYLIEGGQHAWHDWRNPEGWRPAGISIGEPDWRQNFSEEIVRFHLGLSVE